MKQKEDLLLFDSSNVDAKCTYRPALELRQGPNSADAPHSAMRPEIGDAPEQTSIEMRALVFGVGPPSTS